MFDFSRIKHYYIACGYTDMRKQFDVLAALVQMYLGREMEGRRCIYPAEDVRISSRHYTMPARAISCCAKA